MPNPWDAGSTRYLCSLGFPAMATTSAGLSFSHALPDLADALPRDAVIDHIRQIVTAAGSTPVNADFQSGYADTPEGVEESVRRCIETGVAGLSIEDATGRPNAPLFEVDVALERLRAARRAIDASGCDVLLTARAECFLVGHSDPLNESIRRLQAFAEAGADVLYAPGLDRREDITAVVSAVHPKPINVLVSSNAGLSVSELADLGVRRISVGSAMARVAWGAFMASARAISESGRFDSFSAAAPFAELNALFGRAGDA